MTAHERQLRSSLHQILHQQGVIHGSLIVRKRACGKGGCRCARGQLHESLYLVVTEGGKGRQMYVPRSWEAAVRQWIDQYAQARRIMDDLSRLHWDKVRQRQDWSFFADFWLTDKPS
jgi:hypothetical protein